MSKIKALILDAGGVLVHPFHGDWFVPVKYREYLGQYAQDIHSEAWRDACRAEASRLREDACVPDIETEYGLRLEFLSAVAARLGWQLSTEALEALAHDFTWNVDRHAWYGDAQQWLEKWHGEMIVGILSDAMPSFLHVLGSHPAGNCVHAALVSTEIGVTKPDARMYLEICRRLNVAPGDCLFVDDRPCNLEGAMACGMRAVQMCRDGLPAWDGSHVHDLSELNRYMEGLN